MKRFNSYNKYLRTLFPGRVQKISLDAGFTCPNRDGSKSSSGCIYCNNKTFNPFYCTPLKTVSQQLAEGIAFFSAKYKSMQYLAYFQAYSNTYASPEKLRELYDEALDYPQIIGLVISTRPDCVNERILDLLAEYSRRYFVVVEYGVESCHDQTLALINRCHNWNDVTTAITETAARGITTGAHLILGLPGEDEEMIMENARKIATLPVNILKLHQMQVIRGTQLEKMYLNNSGIITDLSLDNYIEMVVSFLEFLNPEIMLERFCSESPRDMILYPDWGGKKNFEVTHKIEKLLLEKNTWQGRIYQP